MRDYAVLAVILASLPFCFRKPFLGILVWSWIAYMNPHRFAWGMAKTFPVAQYVGLATLAGFLVSSEKKKIPKEPETILLALLWMTFLVSGFFALYPNSAWAQFQEVSKILLMSFVTVILVTDQKRLRSLLLVIAFSLGLLGVKGAVFTIMTGGTWNVRGPDGKSPL